MSVPHCLRCLFIQQLLLFVLVFFLFFFLCLTNLFDLRCRYSRSARVVFTESSSYRADESSSQIKQSLSQRLPVKTLLSSSTPVHYLKKKNTAGEQCGQLRCRFNVLTLFVCTVCVSQFFPAYNWTLTHPAPFCYCVAGFWVEFFSLSANSCLNSKDGCGGFCPFSMSAINTVFMF